MGAGSYPNIIKDRVNIIVMEGGVLKAFPLRNKTRTSALPVLNIKDLGTAVSIEK